MSEPLVSVLIPAYNAERYLATTLESALVQTWPHIEVVVVDDGSTDGTLAVARTFEARGVRVIEQANAGASAARNRAFAASRGKYVQYLDADDLLSADKVASGVRLLETSSRGCVAVSGTVFFQDGSEPAGGRAVPGYPALNSDNPAEWLVTLWTPGPGYGVTRWGMVQPAAWLVPRRCVDAAGPWDETISVDDDGEFFTRVLMASKGIRWDPVGYVYYRQYQSKGSLSSHRDVKAMEGWLRSIASKEAYVLAKAGASLLPQARAALARQYEDLAYHAYPAHPSIVAVAEQCAQRLGGYGTVFFGHSKFGSGIERVAGWKAAKRVSTAIHRLRGLRSSLK